MGDACQCSDRHETAEAYYLEALQIASDLGLQPEMAHCQNGLAQACFLLGRSGDGDRLRSAAIALYSSLKMPAPPTDFPIAGSSAHRAP